jgi:demethylmenaquinone methyltransferase / 2-methoxy-6-polyprenyl-1,4-benzoquinol methylase
MTDTAPTGTVSFGYEDVAPDEKTARVGGVFSSVAKNYDLMNDAMSGGMHRLWKDRFVRRLQPREGEADTRHGGRHRRHRLPHRGIGRVGDGRGHQPRHARGRHGTRGQARARQPRVDRGKCRDADLPGPFFDAYTIAFGIRNVTDIPKALREAHRVLRRGGRFFCLEFSTTTWPGFKEVYDGYSHKLVPKLGQLLAQDADSYRYLIESIRRFPDMPTFKGMIADAGFVRTKVEPIMGGLVAIHSGWKI